MSLFKELANDLSKIHEGIRQAEQSEHEQAKRKPVEIVEMTTTELDTITAEIRRQQDPYATQD